MNTTTNIAFHKEMQKYADVISDYLTPFPDFDMSLSEQYFFIINHWELNTQEKIFKYFLDIIPYAYASFMDNEAAVNHLERDLKKYFEGISSINYELAKKVSGKEDLSISVNGKEFTLPFYVSDIYIPNMEIKLEGNEITLVKCYDYETIFDKELDAYIRKSFQSVYRLYANEDNVITSFFPDKIYEDIDLSTLNEYDVSYKCYCSYFFDPGSTCSVFAENKEEAVDILIAVKDSPEDGEIYSYSVNYEPIGSQRYSYLEAVENPGIARAEAMAS